MREQQLAKIRKRTEAQENRYGFRWNQILHDRRDLLDEVDRLTDVIVSAYTALVADEDDNAYEILRRIAAQEYAKRANDPQFPQHQVEP